MPLKDLSGERFGRLVVLRRAIQTGKTKNARWLCQCDCGAMHEANSSALIRGLTKSCKCLARELTSSRASIHNKSRTVEWSTWQNMKNRCYNEKDASYIHYGGRGIRVCDSWINSFINFFSVMGERPSPEHSIDRIDVNGDYTPENCRWATKSEQAKNKRPVTAIEILGVVKTLNDWSKLSGVNKQTISKRMQSGVTGEALIAPPASNKSHPRTSI